MVFTFKLKIFKHKKKKAVWPFPSFSFFCQVRFTFIPHRVVGRVKWEHAHETVGTDTETCQICVIAFFSQNNTLLGLPCSKPPVPHCLLGKPLASNPRIQTHLCSTLSYPPPLSPIYRKGFTSPYSHCSFCPSCIMPCPFLALLMSLSSAT